MGLILGLIVVACTRVDANAIYTSNVQKDVDADLNLALAKENFLISAYFGLDNGLPEGVEGMCKGGSGADGMPVIFSKELDPKTVQPGDLNVTTSSGKTGSVYCTTFLPAIDAGELRTVLLIGEFGTAISDEPVSVEVVGNVYDHKGESNFKGQKVEVTPLASGPFLVRAEIPSREQWKMDARGPSIGVRGSGCPGDTKMAIRAVWSGGISKPGGEPANEKEKALYQVSMTMANGNSKTISPASVADLGDGDNNHMLCMSQKGTVQSVFFPKGYLTDPNEDATNPDTKVSLSVP